MISVLLAVMPVFFIRIVVIGGREIVSMLERVDVVHGRRRGGAVETIMHMGMGVREPRE